MAYAHHPSGVRVWLVVVVLVWFVLILPALSAWYMDRRGGGDDSGGDDGPGEPPPEPPPTSEGPSWWAEFERDFAAHVAATRPNAQERETPGVR